MQRRPSPSPFRRPDDEPPETGLEERGRRGPVARKRMRIEDWVRVGLSSGSIRPGDRLPDRKAVAARFGVTVATVQKAFDALAAEGFVVATRGHGTRAADPPPFAGRYLLVVCGRDGKVADSLFDRALCRAAAVVAERRGVVFETAPILDEPDEGALRDVAARARQQSYAGVFLRAVEPGRRHCGPLLRLNHVPVCGFFQTDGTEGALVRPLRDIQHTGLAPLFAACQRANRRRLAVFTSHDSGDSRDGEAPARRLARSLGLEIGPWHYHDFDIGHLRPHALERTLRAVFAAEDVAWRPDAIVIGDDNLVATVARHLVQRLGRKAASQLLLVALGNRPCLPETELPVRFHGLDLVATLDSFVAWADRCHAGRRRRPSAPAPVRFPHAGAGGKDKADAPPKRDARHESGARSPG